jgi:hypothetical protein
LRSCTDTLRQGRFFGPGSGVEAAEALAETAISAAFAGASGVDEILDAERVGAEASVFRLLRQNLRAYGAALLARASGGRSRALEV